MIVTQLETKTKKSKSQVTKMSNDRFMNPVTSRWCLFNKPAHTKLVKHGIVDRSGNTVPGWESRVDDYKAVSGMKGYGPGPDEELVITKPLTGAAKTAHEAKVARIAAAKAAKAEAEAAEAKVEVQEVKPAKGAKSAAKTAKPPKVVKPVVKAAKGKVSKVPPEKSVDDLLAHCIQSVKSEREQSVAQRSSKQIRGRKIKFEPAQVVIESEDEEKFAEESAAEEEDTEADEVSEDEEDEAEDSEFPETDSDDSDEDRTIEV